jgi:AcrR family transcriptional regulator
MRHASFKVNMVTRRTQAERSAATRDALLSAARVLFSQQGYAATAREEIVAAAGVTRGALQHHFGDKKGLFLALYEEIEQETVTAVAEAAMKAGDDPFDRLRAGCRAYLDEVVDDSTVRRVCAIDGPAVLSAEERQEITDRYALSLVRESLRQAMAAGRIDEVPVDTLAHMLLAAVTAAAQHVASASRPEVTRAEAKRAVDLLFDGLQR